MKKIIMTLVLGMAVSLFCTQGAMAQTDTGTGQSGNGGSTQTTGEGGGTQGQGGDDGSPAPSTIDDTDIGLPR